MSELFNKLLILRMPGIGPVRYGELIARFGTPASAAASLNADDSHVAAVRREMERARDIGAHYICDDDELYPTALKNVKNHPPIICAIGNLETLRRPTVGIVGTRHATAAGMAFAADMAYRFAENGFAVASGMAIGTDSAAHRGALRAQTDTATIAVLAGGVDYIWPVENESLYRAIAMRGVVISEMPVGFVPNATNFIQRNRWIAGISQKLILSEADLNSGSMSTARFAIDFGRDVFAVPSHPSDSRALGPNSLIKSGVAKLCMGASDFFDAAQKNTRVQKSLKKNDDEISLLDKIGTIPASESVLAEVAKKTVSEIKRDLVVLELQGLVRKVDGGYVRM